jgi:hypothetical protein
MPHELPPPAAFAKDLWVRNELGLYLPRSYAKEAQQPKRHRMLEFTVIAVEWSALTGSPPTIEGVLSRLRRYSLREVVSLISRITLTLALADDNAGLVDPAIQDRLLTNLLGDDAMHNLWAAILKRPDYTRERTVFFNERQLLNTLKLAFLELDLDTTPPATAPDPARLLPFVEALLMVSEIIDSRAGRTREGTALSMADQLELYTYANILFNAEGNHVREIVRSHYFYVESHPEITSKAGLVDLPQQLAAVTGLSAGRTWAALFALFTGFGVLSHEDIDAGRVAVSRRNYLAALSALEAGEAERWFSLGTATAAEMQSAVRSQYSIDAPNWFDVLVFEVHPLVSFGDDVLCLSLPQFRKLQTTSLWYRLIHPSLPKETREKALHTRGRLLEAYAAAILRRTFGDRYYDEEALNACVNPAPAPGSHRKGRKSKLPVCDGLVVLGDIALLFEVKESSLSLDARQATNFAKYREMRKKLVTSAATQLEATAQHLRACRLIGIGVDASRIRHIIPIIVSMDQPVTPGLYDSVREQDLRGSPLQEAMRKGLVEPLQLINLADIELLETIAEKGADVSQLLLSKGRSSDEVGLAFNQFCRGRTDVDLRNHGAWYGERYHQIMDVDMTLELRSAGMSATEMEAAESVESQVADVAPTNA